MYPISLPVTPALRGHLLAQMSLIDDVSRSMFSSVEKLTGVNMLALRAVLDDALTMNPHKWPIFRADFAAPSEAAAGPVVGGLSAYHQQISRITVESKNDLARISLAHFIVTCRTTDSIRGKCAQRRRSGNRGVQLRSRGQSGASAVRPDRVSVCSACVIAQPDRRQTHR